METEDLLALGQLLATAFAGLAGLAVSYGVYRLAARQREDSWQHLFAAIHDQFWKDDDFATVRRWLACPKAYDELGTVLAKRRDSHEAAQLEPKDYEKLEKLDKFLNLITRVIALDTRPNRHRLLLDQLFFSYWLKRAVGKTDDDIVSHEHLYWYVQHFYPTITSYAPCVATARKAK
jgi:hypothetical protein